MSKLFTLLQVAFIVLKLCRIIDWNWFLVLAPVIVYFVVGAISRPRTR